MIGLDDNLVILIHLGMTGKFFIVNHKNEKKKTSFYYDLKDGNVKHNHIVFYLSKNKKLIYNDVRKFGFIKILKKKDLKKNSHLKLLGPEPLSKELNVNYFKDYISKRDRNIKNILMDQKFISGLGNIYVNEVLFLSKINPKRKVISIKKREILRIIKSIKKILAESIKKGGSSIKNFEGVKGKSGTFQQKLTFIPEKEKDAREMAVKALLPKLTYLIVQPFFVEVAKNKKLTLIF
jgi:formamidopyrimidine-DNA glycosylase